MTVSRSARLAPSREEDIFPDPLSAALADGWRNGAAKMLERQLAPAVPITAADS